MSNGPKQLGNAQVSVFDLNSTGPIKAMAVVQLDSTGGIVSGSPGGGSTQVSIKEILTSSGASVMDSTDNAIRVNVVAGAAAGSTLVTIRQSTYTDLNALSRIADRDASTQVAAVLNTTPVSTAYGLAVRLAAPIADSTQNALRVTNPAGSAILVRSDNSTMTVRQSTASDLQVTATPASTTWTVQASSLSGRVLIDQNSTVFQTQNVLRDRDQSTQIAAVVNATAPASTAYGLVVRMPAPVTDSTNNALRVNVVAGAAGGSTQVTVSQLLDSSGGSVATGDSANNAIRVNVVAGAAGGSTIVTVSTGSVRVHQSTAADLQVTATPVSTVWTVQASTLAGRVLVDQNSTVWQTQAALRTSSGGGVEGSTSRPAQGVLGIHVRAVSPDEQSTTVLITSSNSTATYELCSSAAALRQKVYAYVVTSTVTNPSTVVFCSVGSSDNTTADRWAIQLGSGSSGITGANLALSPPASIFKSITADALKVRVENGASTQTIVRISVSWFSEA